MAKFELNLEDNSFDLHKKLNSGEWKPDSYIFFFIQDPKLRKIHKASVRDRVLYQAVYRKLYQVFDKNFIFDSYSSRNGKGTHKGVERLEKFTRKTSENHKSSAFALKCDIRKFFDSIDHKILLELISRKISDRKILDLIEKIISSFETLPGKGLPLGNVTSQLFANIYLNELDQFAKHELKVKFYARYCDDFVIIDKSLQKLQLYLEKLKNFCQKTLLLEIHPKKIIFRKIHPGADFLGMVILPFRKILRTKTKRRMLRRIAKIKEEFEEGNIDIGRIESPVQSYLGMLSHVKGEKIMRQIERIFWD